MAATTKARRSSKGRARLLGSETPRIFTPPLRPLVDAAYDDDGGLIRPATTLGFEVIRFAKAISIDLYPWQKWLLVHALELREDGLFRFRTLVVLVARQNGKSMLSQILALWALYVLGVGLIIGTAQDLDTAEEVWDGVLDIIEGDEELSEMALPPVKANGKKAIRLKTGERYKVKAATRRGARGLSGDLILLDELREHQNWEAWGAITKTTMARPKAQVWALSNAGDASSVVLRYLRKMAHAALGDPDGINAADDPASLLIDDDLPEDIAETVAIDEDDDSLGLFEWSAPPGCDVHDREMWPLANPSLGHSLSDDVGITERAIAAAAHTDPEWTFRTEVLCQWSDGTLEGPFPAGKWEAGIDKDSMIADDSPIGACVDVSWDRSRTHIAVAGYREDGLPHVEVVASRAGTDWVVGWFTNADYPDRKLLQPAIQPTSPAGSLIEDLQNAGIQVHEWKGTELSQDCGRLYDEVVKGRLRHRPQPVLDVAAATAVTRPLNDSWVWDRKKSPVDAAPLVAGTGALAQIGEAAVEPWAFFG